MVTSPCADGVIQGAQTTRLAAQGCDVAFDVARLQPTLQLQPSIFGIRACRKTSELFIRKKSVIFSEKTSELFSRDLARA